jgi:hypothetical protein
MSKTVRLVGALLLAFAVSVGAQSAGTLLNGLWYTFPASDGTAGQVLVNSGAGTLTWTTASPGGSAVMPAGLLVFANVACPAGYSTYNTASGFYPVGATTGLGGTVGTALTDQQNRATGSHTHSASGIVSISNGSHTHTITDTGHNHSWNPAATGNGRPPAEILTDPGPPEVWEWEPIGGYGVTGSARSSGSSGASVTTGSTSISASGSVDSFTIGNGGTGTGTNAPYRQLRMCQKS